MISIGSVLLEEITYRRYSRWQDVARLIGYCFLARTLSLAPWNRSQPLTWQVIRETYLGVASAVPPCGAGVTTGFSKVPDNSD